MGTCSIDHSQDDVKQKLESQREFLPEAIVERLQRFLANEQSQQTLNEVFHLLKKYDLASKSEQEDRNRQLLQLLNVI